jgi:hypothetical protein
MTSAFMVGATCFEVQILRMCIRVLRPQCYFWPYRHFITRRLVIPRVITIRITDAA